LDLLRDVAAGFSMKGGGGSRLDVAGEMAARAVVSSAVVVTVYLHVD
jgi:hypothetical protein